MLQLYESGRDGSYVALLIAEGDSAGSFGILELRIGVDAGVTDTAVEPVHDHGELHGLQRPRHAADEDGLSRIERHGGVQHEVGVAESPGSDLHGLVLDRGRAHAQVELVLVLNAGVYQLLHRALVLKRVERSREKFEQFIDNEEIERLTCENGKERKKNLDNWIVTLPGKAETRSPSVESRIYSPPCAASLRPTDRSDGNWL